MMKLALARHPPSCLLVAVLASLLAVPHACAQGADQAWPSVVRRIEYTSSADQSQQPALFYASDSSRPRPVLVALHTWSFDYTQVSSIPYAEWCIEKDWVFIHPNFRGPNNNPQATGSELVVADILSAVEYAKAHALVDATRIYLVGESGGGYAALLLAGRAPHIWAGVSAWGPITDLGDWYFETKSRNLKYAQEIVASCGGIPQRGSAAETECRKRSAMTYLANARGLLIDINAGIRDGHGTNGPVPICQSLRAYNLLAHPADRLSEEAIDIMVKLAHVPKELRFSGKDPLYGDNQVLLRRQSGKVRLSLFDGGHEIIHRAALAWLAAQKKP